MSNDTARQIDPEALEVADETSRAAAFLEQQLSETAPDMDAELRRALARLGASMAKKKHNPGQARAGATKGSASPQNSAGNTASHLAGAGKRCAQ